MLGKITPYKTRNFVLSVIFYSLIWNILSIFSKRNQFINLEKLLSRIHGQVNNYTETVAPFHLTDLVIHEGLELRMITAKLTPRSIANCRYIRIVLIRFNRAIFMLLSARQGFEGVMLFKKTELMENEKEFYLTSSMSITTMFGGRFSCFSDETLTRTIAARNRNRCHNFNFMVAKNGCVYLKKNMKIGFWDLNMLDVDTVIFDVTIIYLLK